MRRLLLCLVIAAVLAPAASMGDEFYDAQMKRGIRNSDPYSYQLMRQAGQGGTDALQILKQAAAYSPDLPAVHFALARESLLSQGSGVLAGVDHMIDGLYAYSRNFWWSFTLTGALFCTLVISFMLSYIAILAVRLPRDIPLITHDISESPSRVTGLVILAALSLVSPLCLIAGLLVLTGIYMKRVDRSTVYAFLVFLLFLPVILYMASFYIGSAASGKVKAVVQVNEARGNAYAQGLLSSDPEKTAAFSYALSLKREGRYQEAIDIYEDLSSGGQDPRVLVNLGNCYVGLYNFDEEKKGYLNEAIKYYTMANALKPLASAYYNLSQVSRELLEFDKGNTYYKDALNVDRSAVAEFSSMAARQTNRFVIDETIPGKELREYARASSGKIYPSGLSMLPPVLVPAIALVLLIAFALLPGRLRHTAYRCRKCGNVLCRRCERELVVGQICSQCYGSILRLAELDVRERVARILSLYDQQKRRRLILKILSFVLPGASQVYAGKILSGFLIMWPFLFCAVFPLVSAFFYPASSLISHWVVSLGMLLLALIIYVFSNIITRRGIVKGWL